MGAERTWGPDVKVPACSSSLEWRGEGATVRPVPRPQPPMPPPPGGSLVRGLSWQRGPWDAGVCGLGDPQRHTQAPCSRAVCTPTPRGALGCSRGSEAPQTPTWCPITHRPPEPVSHEEHPGNGSMADPEGCP